MSRCAIYVRVSSKGQEEGTSLATQEAACRAYAAEHDLVIDEQHVYRETFTGVELWDRPQLTRLRAAIARGEVDVVVAHAIDRLSRDPVHLGVILSEADHRGVAVAFVTEPLDDSPEGQLIQYVRGYAAKIEHMKIRERSMRGKRARAESGKLMAAGRPRYGYQWRDDTKAAYDLDPEKSLVVRRIYHQYVDGYSLRQIARGLTRDGIPTPTGLATWQCDPVRKILTHPFYSGRASNWGFCKRPNQAARFDPETAIPLPDGTVPAIVSQAVWDRAQQRLVANKHGAPRDARIPEGSLLLRGRITCAECGGVMSPERYTYTPAGRRDADAGQPRYMYRCRQTSPNGGGCRRCSIQATQIDAAAWEVVVGLLTRPAWIARALERIERDDAAERDLSAIELAIATVEKQRASLARVAGLLENEDDAAPIVAQLEQTGERARQLATERDGILERVRNWEQIQAMVDAFQDWGATVAANAAELGWEDRLTLVELLDVRASVNRHGSEERYAITTRVGGEVLDGVRFGKVSSMTPGIRHFPTISLRFTQADLAA